MVAVKNGWIDSYDWFAVKKRNHYWNEQTCREASKECSNRADFAKKYMSAYNLARKNGWLDDYTWLKRPESHNKKWNEQTCEEESHKYTTRNQFQKGS